MATSQSLCKKKERRITMLYIACTGIMPTLRNTEEKQGGHHLKHVFKFKKRRKSFFTKIYVFSTR